MEGDLPGEGSSGGNAVSGESSDTILELNVKTLDSRTFHFQVNKNVQVSVLKEKIANDIGVSAGQQRLIFRGKVLKDDHLLSQYHVENGDTLHLVERQPTQPQPSLGSESGETTGSIGSQGNNTNAGAPRGRIGQISHSVVLGTFNIGDQGEGGVPDISQVIGSVLSSIGLGNLAQANVGGNRQASVALNVAGQGLQGNGTEGSQANSSVQGQTGNLPSGQAMPNISFQSMPQVVQIPLAAAVPVPSFNSPIPDSLNTLVEFMNRMEQSLSRNANQQNSSTSSVELPSSSRGLPTPEALSIVLHRAEQLLSGQAVSALSHIAERLDLDGSSSDISVRNQLQTESSQTGIAMQHLGALFLEIGRTMLTLRMGMSPGEAFVNAGPAVYISPSGPNPIMVQPFHLQTHSLFGNPVPPVNPVAFGPVGIGNPPRHINIHIHAGTSLAPVVSAAGSRLGTGDGAQGESGNSDSSRDTMTAQAFRNVVSTTGSSNPSSVMSSTLRQPNTFSGAELSPEISTNLSSVIAEINSQIRSLVSNIQEGNQAPSGQAATSVQVSVGSASTQDQPNLVAADAGVGSDHSSTEALLDSVDKSLARSSPTLYLEDSRDNVNSRDVSGPSGDLLPSLKSEGASSTSGLHDAPEGTNSTPLGLGFGGLERKKRAKQPKQQLKGADGGPADTIPERQPMHTDPNYARTESYPAAAQTRNSSNTSSLDQFSQPQMDVAGMMSQVLQSPALNRLLSGVSEQTGVGSPNVLRNMLQQFTQNPVMMNTVGRIAQQVDTQDIGSMFSGLGGGQGGDGGRIDLSRMVQQMMPIVSEALGGGQSGFPSAMGHEIDSHPSERGHDLIEQAELDGVVRHIESRHVPRDIFHSMVESAARASGNRAGSQDVLDTLCSNEGLANEYAEQLCRDLGRRLEGDYGTED
ncbi:hypothetical protein SAY87_002882 [Trapa incisa]|uniref:Ubiquitin-like domain-containing protein n=1 Tax=Trapa incisa TaxID=236973 RepID=A0AAN7KID8_9MYRT|nr:hypothetical protein SAY87_002882 [Trapa incisa]